MGSEITTTMLTDLEERDMLLEEVRRGYQSAKDSNTLAFSKYYRVENRNEVLGATSCFAEHLNETVYLLTKDSETCGAVRVQRGTLLRHCEAVLGIDGDAILVLSQDRTQGFVLDYTPDDPDNCYELTVWGGTWPLKILTCNR